MFTLSDEQIQRAFTEKPLDVWAHSLASEAVERINRVRELHRPMLKNMALEIHEALGRPPTSGELKRISEHVVARCLGVLLASGADPSRGALRDAAKQAAAEAVALESNRHG